MDPRLVLHECADLIGERGKDYGGIENNFRKIAAIASLSTGREITAYEVAMVLVATKLARMSGARDKRDNYLDAINYLVFALEMKNGTAGCDGSAFDPADGRGQ
jgi:hypothetical protein